MMGARQGASLLDSKSCFASNHYRVALSLFLSVCWRGREAQGAGGETVACVCVCVCTYEKAFGLMDDMSQKIVKKKR